MNPLKGSDSSTLKELCKALPFLTQLPVNLLQKLDTTTLYVPKGDVAELRAELESRLHCHIMTYKAAPPESGEHNGLHLCRLLVPASLTPEQLADLQHSQHTCREAGVVLVAYVKPLQLRESSAK